MLMRLERPLPPGMVERIGPAFLVSVARAPNADPEQRARATELAGISGLTAAEALDLANVRKVLTNRLHTDPATGVLTIYDDDDVATLFTANISEDVSAAQAYRTIWL